MRAELPCRGLFAGARAAQRQKPLHMDINVHSLEGSSALVQGTQTPKQAGMAAFMS